MAESRPQLALALLAVMTLSSGAKAGSVPIHVLRGVHAIADVSVNGGPGLHLLVDTGAAQTTLPPELAPVGAARLCLEDRTCVNIPAVVSQTSPYSQPKPGYINGILGFDALRQLRWTLDYRHSRMTVGSLPSGKEARTVPFVVDHTGRPQVMLSVAGLPLGQQLLDTGSSYLRLTPAMAGQISGFESGKTELSFLVASTEVTALSVPLSACLEKSCAASVIVQKAGWPAVGGSFLNRFVIGLDGPGNRLILVPSPGAPLEAMSPIHRLGFQIRTDDAAAVAYVVEGSIAASAGLVAGDRIATINGKAIGDLGYVGAIEVLQGRTAPPLTLENGRDIRFGN